MRIPRFTTLQLLLGAALVALLLGLFVEANREHGLEQIDLFCFSPSGRYLAAKYGNGGVRLWRIESKSSHLVAEAFAPRKHLGSSRAYIHFNGDDRLISVDTSGKYASATQVRSLNVESGEVTEVMSLAGVYLDPSSAAVDENRLIAFPFNKGTIHRYNLENAKLEEVIPLALPANGQWLRMSDDGSVLAVTDTTNKVHIFDTQTGRCITSISTANWETLSVSADGSQVAVPAIGVPDSQPIPGFTVFPTHSSHEACTIAVKSKRGVWWLAFSRDGSKIIAADNEVLECYDLNTKTLLRRSVIADLMPDTHVPSVGPRPLFRRIAFSPDGSAFVVADGEQIHLWDIATGKLRHTVGRSHPWASMFVFITGLSLWAAAWGIVRKGFRSRTGATTDASQSDRSVGRIYVPFPIWICWGTMVIGGLVAIAVPISAIFLLGPIMFFLPTLYLSLLVGVSAIARGAACDTIGLNQVSCLQVLNLVACDPINFILALLEFDLIRSASAQEYLRAVN